MATKATVKTEKSLYSTLLQQSQGEKDTQEVQFLVKQKELDLQADILATQQSLIAEKAKRNTMLSSKDLTFSNLVEVDQRIEELEKGLQKLTEYQQTLF